MIFEANDGTKIKEIGEMAFEQNRTLETAVLPDGLQEIAQQMFQDCDAMSRVYIPASVQSIGLDAFQGCKLTDVYYGGTREQWNKIKKQKGNGALGRAEFHENASGAALQTAAQFF